MFGQNWRTSIETALTFDDILMVPQYSEVQSRSECLLKTKFSRNIPLKIPFVSSPMDTVTETNMAIAMAQNGGLGIIHRFMELEEQVHQIKKVKRYESFFKINPYMVGLNFKLSQVRELSEQLNVKSFLVTHDELLTQEQGKILKAGSPRKPTETETSYPLLGIITHRDFRHKSDDLLVKNVMTPREKLIVIEYNNQNKEEAIQKMIDNKIEKLPVIQDNYIKGLVNLKDLEFQEKFQIKNQDSRGQLLVGGSVGGRDDDVDKAIALVNAGADVIVIDIANGHSTLAIKQTQRLKQELPEHIDVVAGSVASGEGAEALIKAGADGIRCGIGNGSICITRVVSGCGVPQFSALMDVAPVCKKYNIPLISDGGNKNSGNMCKALGVGADCVMLGRLVAGCEESPSKELYRDGKIVKVYRGMAGLGANVSKAQRTGNQEPAGTTFTPEGVEGYIPYAGSVSLVLNQFAKGVQSGMSYCGAFTIQELQQKVRFIRMTQNGLSESGVHGIQKI